MDGVVVLMFGSGMVAWRDERTHPLEGACAARLAASISRSGGGGQGWRPVGPGDVGPIL